MAEPQKLVFYHDSDGLDYISAFAKAIKPFGIYVIDVTPKKGETVEVVVTDKPPAEGQEEWRY